MKKYTLNSDICRMPVVNMESGKVISRSFIPFFDKDKLELIGLDLTLDNGGKIQVPFSSICFINDICVMVRLPEAPYRLPNENCCRGFRWNHNKCTLCMFGSKFNAFTRAACLINNWRTLWRRFA